MISNTLLEPTYFKVFLIDLAHMLNSRYQRLLGTFLLFSFGALLFNLLLPLKAFDARPRQRQLESLSESKAKIQLISQWYWPRNALRTAELIRALRLNLENTAIDEIHLLQPSGPSENARTNKSNDDNDSEVAMFISPYLLDTIAIRMEPGEYAGKAAARGSRLSHFSVSS